MKAITPIATTTTATQIELTIIYDNLVDTAHVAYVFKTAEGTPVQPSSLNVNGAVIIDGADYQSWGANGQDVNEQIYDIVMNKLGISPATI